LHSVRRPIDPQLDTSFLIRLAASDPPFLAYAVANRAAGLRYSPAAGAEFLAAGGGSAAQLQSLQQRFGIQAISGLATAALDNAARRLQNAFQGGPRGRVLHAEDAKVLAAAFLLGEPLATGDLRLYKRGRDLGPPVEFVGAVRPTAVAAAYVPQGVVIPP
jgi:predicted nucleic acid-binding protein